MKKHLFPLLRIDVSRKSGVSLVETVIALLILSIAILAIAGVPIMSSKLAIHASQRDQAMFLAVKTLDFLEAQPHTSSIASQDVVDDFTITYWKPVFVESSPDNHVGRATVTWRGVAGQSSLNLERILSKFSSSTREE